MPQAPDTPWYHRWHTRVTAAAALLAALATIGHVSEGAYSFLSSVLPDWMLPKVETNDASDAKLTTILNTPTVSKEYLNSVLGTPISTTDLGPDGIDEGTLLHYENNQLILSVEVGKDGQIIGYTISLKRGAHFLQDALHQAGLQAEGSTVAHLSETFTKSSAFYVPHGWPWRAGSVRGNILGLTDAEIPGFGNFAVVYRFFENPGCLTEAYKDESGEPGFGRRIVFFDDPLYLAPVATYFHDLGCGGANTRGRLIALTRLYKWKNHFPSKGPLLNVGQLAAVQSQQLVIDAQRASNFLNRDF